MTELNAWQWAVGQAVIFGDDTLDLTVLQVQGLTERIERAFMALPVEARAEAMGMERVGSAPQGSWGLPSDPPVFKERQK